MTSADHRCWNCDVDVGASQLSCTACGETLRLGDRYAIRGRIQDGPTGVVYQAWDEARKCSVALKRPHAKQAKSSDEGPPASTHYRSLTSLHHPGIAALEAVEVQDEQLYFVQQLSEGRPFEGVFGVGNARASIGEACHVGERLLETLVYAHDHGSCHRDIKPGNILLITRRGIHEPVLTDFGIGRRLDARRTDALLRATPGYTAPEQVANRLSEDPRSDLYAVGAILYSMLLGGRIPYHLALYDGIESEPEALRRAYEDIAKGDVPLQDITIARPELTADLASILQRALRPTPTARFHSAKEMLLGLRAAVEHSVSSSAEGLAAQKIDLSKIEASEDLVKRRQHVQRRRFLSRSVAGAGLLMVLVGLYLSDLRADARNEAAAKARALSLASARASATAAAMTRARNAPMNASPFLFPGGIAIDEGKVYVADRGAHRIQFIEEKRVGTLAGSMRQGFAEGPVATAAFDAPHDVAVSEKGVVYVADTGNNRIRRIRDGVVSTLAGHADAGHADGKATEARFRRPTGLSFGADGFLYVADRGNHCIRRIDVKTGEVDTYAGATTAKGVKGPLVRAQLTSPSSLAVAADGAVYLTEAHTWRLRVIDHGAVATIAAIGSASSSSLPGAGRFEPVRLDAHPQVAIGPKGTVFVTDPRQHVVLKLEQDKLRRLAGNADKAGFRDGIAQLARFRSPHGIAVSASGTIYVTDHRDHTLRAIREQMVLTVVQGRTGGFADGPTTEARFGDPWKLDADTRGLLVTDGLARRVRRISRGAVRTITVAGSDQEHNDTKPLIDFGDDPGDLSTGPRGRVFVADSANHRIAMISSDEEEISTLAGTGQPGSKDGPVASAEFTRPEGIAAKNDGALFVADTGNHLIRKISNGQVSTAAGSGKLGFDDGDAKREASFRFPQSIAVTRDGMLYIADTGNHAIRRLFEGRVETIAGTGEPGFADGQPQSAQFQAPEGIAVGDDGTIYVADTGNQRVRVIKDGMVSTIAGIGLPGYRDGPASLAAFSMPSDVAIVNEQVFVADSGNKLIRVIVDGFVGTAAGR